MLVLTLKLSAWRAAEEELPGACEGACKPEEEIPEEETHAGLIC